MADTTDHDGDLRCPDCLGSTSIHGFGDATCVFRFGGTESAANYAVEAVEVVSFDEDIDGGHVEDMWCDHCGKLETQGRIAQYCSGAWTTDAEPAEPPMAFGPTARREVHRLAYQALWGHDPSEGYLAALVNAEAVVAAKRAAR